MSLGLRAGPAGGGCGAGRAAAEERGAGRWVGGRGEVGGKSGLCLGGGGEVPPPLPHVGPGAALWRRGAGALGDPGESRAGAGVEG